MGMDVVFGLWADGGASPGHGGGVAGALGQPVLGPVGLVDMLETALGLGGPPRPQVVRIAAFQASLEALDGTYFWSRSLAMDPWSTARMLLVWRDELIGLGWTPDRDWGEVRLAHLAVACRQATGVPAGLPDRIVGLLKALEDCKASPPTRIRLIDPVTILVSPLRRLVERLQALGCVIETIAVSANAPAETALGKLQRWMLGAPDALEGADGSVTMATASSEPLAAELLGQWVAAQAAPGMVLVAQGGDTALLDHGLSGAGQPQAGRSQSSVHRGSLQLLLLAFKGAWSPFDPHALMELLVFPNSPISPRAARRLASALEEAPGRGGQEWTSAWTEVEENEREYADSDVDKIAKVAPRLAQWREWAEPVLADAGTGMALAQALQICDRVTTWASRRYAATSDVLYSSTTALAGEVRAALAALKRETLPRLLIERVIDQAMGTGQPNPGALAQAAGWRSVAHPGAVWASAETLVWWRFENTTEGNQRAPWTQAERNELAQSGCPADDVTLAARAASAAWERAILNARDRVVLIAAGPDCQTEDSLHPLAHRLKPALDVLASRSNLEDALYTEQIHLAGDVIRREPVNTRALPEAQISWATPPAFSARLNGVTESATSLESLMACQLMWALRHVARLRPGRVRSIPDANQLLGNLAHAIARDVFPPGTPPTPVDAAKRTAALLEDRIDQLAAPLRHPEFAEDLNHARRRLPGAMAALAESLAANNLTVEAIEQQVSGTFETLLAMRGAVDLVARDSAGHPVIVDLKWTRSEKSRIAELASGGAIQLATYGAMIAGAAPYRAGYFLLNQRQFATLAGSGLIGRQVQGKRTFPETWAATVTDWKTWRDAADAGLILATGVDGVSDHLPVDLGLIREVRCDWCDYSTLCRQRGLA
ncbi:PD-(D/E)XK nuclease family protein [Rhizobium leguminosarum]|uniref:PD-(D/E)XK nuclease family protein n=2 Tax=Rhizobium/Agrobacterium group TaxID=227290 RepID=A0A7M3DII8_RHILE|nr:PD-(D/E)XK nuclease family protein [Rhizobium leguminosarum]